ncbi:unnamed protein product, partial [Closterium sp. NIES-54]
PSWPVPARLGPFAACRPPVAARPSACSPPVIARSPPVVASALQPPPVAALPCCRPSRGLAFAARCGLCPAAALLRPCPTAAPVAALPCCCPDRGPDLNRQLRPCPGPAP